jgi:predicted CxxxxCH...CXXCH cytochrome family protein
MMVAAMTLFAAGIYVHNNNAYAACDCTICHGLMHNNCTDWGTNTCTACHGNPPTFNGPVTGGLVKWPATTGSTSAGAHVLISHRLGDASSCQHCHFGGMPVSPIVGDNRLEIGFSIYGYPGAGTTYDAAKLNIPVIGTNGTAITNGGTQICSNIYCHSDGTAVATAIITPNVTLPWSTPTGTAVVNILPCNSCHGFPPSYPQDQPKANSHVMHGNFATCDMCHYATTNDGVHISDAELNANGVYDVVASGGPFTTQGQTVSVSFKYVFDVGGGTCSNISCHGITGQGTGPRIWGNVQPAASGVTCNNTNKASGQESCAVVNPYSGTAPYTFLWNFADSSTGTTNPILHTFKTGEALSVSVTIRDVNRHATTLQASVQTPVFSNGPCPIGQSSGPVLSDAITKSGSTFPVTVTVTDNSVVCDNQWHTGGSNYQEYMMVNWGDGLYDIDYTIGNGTPIQQIFTHTYNGPKNGGGHYQIMVMVKDKYGLVTQQFYDAGI